MEVILAILILWLVTFGIACVSQRGGRYATWSWQQLTAVVTGLVGWIWRAVTAPIVTAWNRYSGLLVGLVAGLAVGTVYGPVIRHLLGL